MKKFLKQLFCKHESIYINTETSIDSLLIAKTLIQCKRCKKSFAQHPHANCCYVMHLHGEIMREHFINRLKSMQLPQFNEPYSENKTLKSALPEAEK